MLQVLDFQFSSVPEGMGQAGIGVPEVDQRVVRPSVTNEKSPAIVLARLAIAFSTG